MAETTQRQQAASRVLVTNLYRNQPILFHALRGSVRLGPFETRELDADVLASPELAFFVRAGLVRVTEADDSKPEVSDEDRAATRQAEAPAPAPDELRSGAPEGRGARRR
ncbi:hypothetical protein V5279_18845 [Bradyrhizobium sp. 26S5]|uniref:hypothetical protein n=1 Tax=Bradyrhizobium sp. 26S5 TaxID=3139729 RepID=UPI0030CD1FB1